MTQPKNLDKVVRVSAEQVEFCNTLGLIVEGCTLEVAEAMLRDLIDSKFYGVSDLGHPTEKQCDVAKKFGFDITKRTKRVGGAVVNDIFDQLNRESIDNQQLKPGDIVVKSWDTDQQRHVISSIQEDGSVYFKGGNMNRAWARSLRKV